MKRVEFNNPILIYSDPAETIEAISIHGKEVLIQYNEYGNTYKIETKEFYYLPEETQKEIQKYLERM